MSQQAPAEGEFFRHFKGGLYQVRAIAQMEETGTRVVVYQALYGNFTVYVRPYDSFTEKVDAEKYPDHAGEYRFTLTAPEAQSKPQKKSIAPVTELRPAEKAAAKTAEELMMDFLDADLFDEKVKILDSMKEAGGITDQIIDNLAAAMDFVIEDGDTADRFAQLETCVLTRARFETGRLR